MNPGDVLLWGQGTGEPLTLTEALVAQRETISGTTVFLGSTFSDTLRPEHADHLRFMGIGGIGRNAALCRAGVLDVLPCHISAIPALIRSGRLRVDVVMVQVSPIGPNGRHSLGLVADYLPEAINAARVIVAEINEQVPRTVGAWLDPARITHAVHTSRLPVEVRTPAAGEIERRIGALVAELIPDRSVVQLGIGAVPQAVAAALTSKHDLGVHSGVIGDWLVDLVEKGAVTNAAKAIDTGVTVTGAVFGTRRLYNFVHDNQQLRMRPISYTHDPAVLRRLDGLVAVNSALEVDLTGQVNAETLGGAHIGAVGGQVDFVRATASSLGGRSVIALRSTAKGGEFSRVVATLADGVTTTPRSDADLVVTEHGVADLRGIPLSGRVQRLISVADPAFRDDLRAAASRQTRLY